MRDWKVVCHTRGKAIRLAFCVSRQMTDLSWQFRSGKEQQIHAVAGTECDEVLNARIPMSRVNRYRIIAINPSSNRQTASSIVQ